MATFSMQNQEIPAIPPYARFCLVFTFCLITMTHDREMGLSCLDLVKNASFFNVNYDVKLSFSGKSQFLHFWQYLSNGLLYESAVNFVVLRGSFHLSEDIFQWKISVSENFDKNHIFGNISAMAYHIKVLLILGYLGDYSTSLRQNYNICT